MKKSWKPMDEMPANISRAMLWIEPRVSGGSVYAGHMLIAYRQPNGWSMDGKGKHMIDKEPAWWRYLPSPPPERTQTGQVMLQVQMDRASGEIK